MSGKPRARAMSTILQDSQPGSHIILSSKNFKVVQRYLRDSLSLAALARRTTVQPRKSLRRLSSSLLICQRIWNVLYAPKSWSALSISFADILSVMLVLDLGSTPTRCVSLFFIVSQSPTCSLAQGLIATRLQECPTCRTKMDTKPVRSYFADRIIKKYVSCSLTRRQVALG